VRPFPDVDGGKWQISTDGGDEPLWNTDGQELFFYKLTDAGTEVYAVSVTDESTFSVGTPELLFTGGYIAGGIVDRPQWDISPDGQRFLMMTRKAEQTSLALVDYWFEELKRLVPTE
jgi:Tol biopolymer transport system component